MARPKQDGLLYFSFDTDFFYADKRIKRLHSKFGNDGLVFFIYLLTEIYRNGYYIRWDTETAEDIAADLHITEGLTEQIMAFLVSRSLLTKRILAGLDTAITSPGIQKRYQEAVKGRKRQIDVDPEIWLLDESETASCIKVTKNYSFSGKNQSKSGKNQSKSGKNHIKESKGKESKEKESNVPDVSPGGFVGRFLSAYPLPENRINRYLAETACIECLMTKQVTEDQLLSAAKNYAETLRIEGRDKDFRYIKKPENFLRDLTYCQYLPGIYEKPEPMVPKNGEGMMKTDYGDLEELEKEILSN